MIPLTAKEANAIANETVLYGLNHRREEILKKIKITSERGEYFYQHEPAPWIRIEEEDVKFFEKLGYFVVRWDHQTIVLSWENKDV